jgi:nicotinate-nucleotide adenylyltransferase
MKIGILGGSFNPPHLGHLHLSNIALNKLQLDQIWWIPTPFNPLKDKSNYISIEERIKMCNTLVFSKHKIKIKKINEIYSFNLVKKLQQQYKNYHFYWICGADNLKNIHLWNNFHKLINIIPFVFFARNDHLKKLSQIKAYQIYQNHRFTKNYHYNFSFYTQHNYKIYNYPSVNFNLTKFNKFIPFFFRDNFVKKLLDPKLALYFTDIVLSNKSIKLNLMNKLPLFLIYHSKNYNLSSSQIRNELKSQNDIII